MPKPPPPDSPFWKVFGVMTKLNTAAFRATRGKVGGRFGKADILLLHHVGAKSGKSRVAPLIYLPDGDDLVLVASKGGSDRHPGWFHNLRANPDTEVELRGERRRVHARVATDEERERYWPRLVAIYKPYDDYQGYTQRRIPLVVLEPRV
ncbi:nitroreductase family deazaflavin-dependent oxidoreductase [Capillimicrobium parvum]|uniref:Deazaflavin-dependent nitroreductase n=1 Tax=Capillimicrobium parvum TaxID=2884022 RepID=A0A9E6Y195_9ACTN|nr:nitroreductase family deazaflavin-dependent oxidoreductase [Capillimicrobium parvum]UGS38080.1 Deazaflavin-dependent nitroreductase [Capillimicrobium parvum]